MNASLVIRCTAFAIVLLSFKFAFASDDTIGTNGINSAGLRLANGSPLTGNGIGIGQVEPFRPGDPTQPGGMPFDTTAGLINSSVDPAEVFFARFATPGMPSSSVTLSPTMNDPNADEISDHAVEVAGVMISTDTQTQPTPQATGVSTGADLYSIGDNSTADFEVASSFAAQQIVMQNGGDIRAVNMSFAIALSGGHALDGNSLFTQFVDWSAAEHNTLYVSAGNQLDSMGMPDGLSLPTDNFNGITVAGSQKEGGVYRRVWSDNNLAFSVDATGDRTSVDILAPSSDVLVATQGTMNVMRDGTSYAAPHVTGTVALLQEYGEERLTNAGAPRWDTDLRRHQVMKAVLMNSADKLIDDGSVMVNGSAVPQGGLLGMERTVVMQDGTSTWLDSFAYDDSLEGLGKFEPLDEQMGTGHLNASRAHTQFSPGEFDNDAADVPLIGWDYGTTTGEDDINRYRFADELQGDSFISITLTWDRVVEFANDANMNGEYDPGDTFEEYVDDGVNPPDDSVINDLDIYLLPKFAANITQTVAASVISVGTVEHLFFQIPETGEYEFWIMQNDTDVGENQDYAVAWWAAAAVSGTAMGDYDGNGIVDAGDYTFWKAQFGTTNAAADGNGDGVVDAADYTVWRDHLGQTVGSASLAQAVPAPASGALALWLAVGLVAGGLPIRGRGCRR